MNAQAGHDFNWMICNVVHCAVTLKTNKNCIYMDNMKMFTVWGGGVDERNFHGFHVSLPKFGNRLL